MSQRPELLLTRPKRPKIIVTAKRVVNIHPDQTVLAALLLVAVIIGIIGRTRLSARYAAMSGRLPITSSAVVGQPAEEQEDSDEDQHGKRPHRGNHDAVTHDSSRRANQQHRARQKRETPGGCQKRRDYESESLGEVDGQHAGNEAATSPGSRCRR